MHSVGHSSTAAAVRGGAIASSRKPVSRRAAVALFFGWIGVTAAGFAVLQQYKSVPGAPSTPPAQWPASSAIPFTTTGKTLLLFAHPKCPCTRATLRELQSIQAQCSAPLNIVVVFTGPKPTDANDDTVDWRNTDVVRAAENLHGAEVRRDDDGAMAALFAACTSGQALLYDERGQLLFNGGITASRGHEGDNAGRRAIVGRAVGQTDLPASTPVYGCPLYRRDLQPDCNLESCPPRA